VQLGRIVGTVIASQKDEKLEGLRLHVVKNLVSRPGAKGEPSILEESSSFVVAIDSVGAGVGEVVLYATGSSARQTAQTKDRPCDAVIMAIVDQIDTAEGQLYTKVGT
jgi:microcompartment protein CcmK/EutM